MDITFILKAIITLIFVILITYVVPWIKTATSESNFVETLKWVKIAVECAEMIFRESGMGKEKFAYVESFLANKGYIYDEEEIRALIEAAVLEMKKGIEDEQKE